MNRPRKSRDLEPAPPPRSKFVAAAVQSGAVLFNSMGLGSGTTPFVVF
jgi:hypothetical protein